MSGVLERLLRDKDSSEAKSYFIGLERGRIWAEDYADYFELREWSEEDATRFEDLILPHNEVKYFRLLTMETPLEWNAYLKGWIDGVKEIRQKY